MNLCNSGLADCFHSGNSPTEAASVVLQYQPVAVTLNEICYDDIYKPGAPLPSAMQEVAASNGDSTYFLEFQPAWNRSTNSAYQCRGGRGEYGIGILARGPSLGGYGGIGVSGATYPVQDTRDNEERAWLCLAVRGSFDVCTTHLASTSPAVAFQQCQYLMSSSVGEPAVPWFRYSEGYDPAVVAGDLNLTYGGDPDAQSCVPSGWFRKGDGDVQHVMATSNFGFVSSRAIGMADTDHSALLVDLTYTNRTGPLALGIPGNCADVRAPRPPMEPCARYLVGDLPGERPQVRGHARGQVWPIPRVAVPAPRLATSVLSRA